MEHLDRETLNDYFSGNLPDQESGYCESHLAECDTCRQKLAFLVRLTDENVTPEESAILDALDPKDERRKKRERDGAVFVPKTGPVAPSSWWPWPVWKWAIAGVATIAIIVVAGAFLSHESLRTSTDSGARTLEARLSGQAYAQFVHTRTGLASDPADTVDSGTDELSRLTGNELETGKYYLNHAEFEKAIRHLEMASHREPDSIEIYNDLGVAYMESSADDALEKAAEQFQEALKRDPRYQPAAFNLALAYERMGRFAAAKEQLSRYLEIDSDSDWAKEVQSKLQLWNH